VKIILFALVPLILSMGILSVIQFSDADSTTPSSKSNSDTAFTAATFADKYNDVLFTGNRVNVVIKVTGESENPDHAKRAKEIRYLQSYVLKFLSFSNAVNVVSNPQENEITAQIDSAWIPILEQRGDVISVTVLDVQKNNTENLDRLPPLKQIKSGIALIDVKCNEGKYVVYKRDRMSAACVTQETENKLIFERGWAALRLGLPATDNLPRDLCSFYQGKWLAEYKECNLLEIPLQCSLLGGVYNECASACRHDPDFPNVICTDNCVEVCSIESSTLEDIKNNPVVEAFYARYDRTGESVRSDHVSYSAGNEVDFLVRMNLYFDDSYDLTHMQFYCYDGGKLQHEVAQEDILDYLQNYHCQTYRLGE
jgi:hypothetical protein